MPAKEFRPLRPIKEFDRLNPRAFDPRESVFIPELGVEDRNIRTVSPRKIELIGGKIYSAAVANTYTSGAAAADVVFDTTLFQRGVTISSTYKTIKVPHAGVYIISANVEWAQGTANRTIWIYLNGVDVEGDGRTNDGANFATKQSLTTIRRLSSGDTVGLQAKQNSGGNLAIADGEDNCSLSVVFLGSI